MPYTNRKWGYKFPVSPVAGTDPLFHGSFDEQTSISLPLRFNKTVFCLNQTNSDLYGGLHFNSARYQREWASYDQDE